MLFISIIHIMTIKKNNGIKRMLIILFYKILRRPTLLKISVPVAQSIEQSLEHCVNSAKVVGSIPREHIY